MSSSKRNKIYFLPNVITAFGLTCGLFVIFKMNMISSDEVSLSVLTAAAGILLLAAFADLLDGAIARAMRAESEFGGIFDSLADAISFGVAPSVIILKSVSITPGSSLSFFLTAAAIVFSLCGVLRLVRFNLNALQAKGNEELMLAHKKHFTGLPIPAAAAAAVSANLFLIANQADLFLTDYLRTWILACVLIVLGSCMISRWKFPSIKSLEIKIHSFRAVVLIVLSAVLIFYGILHHFSLVFLSIAWGYIFVAWTLAIIRLIAGRKSKTLEEFEPDPDVLEED